MKNIAKYGYHETVRVGEAIDDTLGNVRRGLMKQCGRSSFKQKVFKTSSASASEDLGTAAVAGQIQAPGHIKWADKRIVNVPGRLSIQGYSRVVEATMSQHRR